MLKQAVAALLLANLGTALYTQGGLRWLGLGALDEREPQRLAQQLHPEQLQLLKVAPSAAPAVGLQPTASPAPELTTATPAALAPTAPVAPTTTPSPPSTPTVAKPAEAPTPAPAQLQPKKNDQAEKPAKTETPDKEPARKPPPAEESAKPEKPTKPEKADKTDKAKDPEPTKTAAKRRGKTNCWQASGYTPVQTIVLNGALDRVPELDKRWQIVATTSGSSGRWLVYQGGFASADALKQQRAEYKLANIDHRPLQLPGESGPGLVLGTYSSEAGAQRALQNAQRDGASHLRVVPEKGGSAARSYTLTLKAITEEEKALVEGLGPALAGKTLQRCP
ncbi:MAG: hypothetical protein PHW78_02150 [Macromonas bipunctata]|nr:hypothetical protein [Macromonas bipunctata]